MNGPEPGRTGPGTARSGASPYSVGPAGEAGEPTAEQVAAAVGRLLPEAGPVRPVRALLKGHRHASWVFDSGRGALIGKVAPARRAAVAVRRLAEYRRVWEHGVPMPRLLGFTDSGDLADGRLLIVYEYLPGRDAEDAARTLPPAAMERVLADAGAALARLHQVPVTAFGDAVTGVTAGPDSWGAAVASRAERLARTYRDRRDRAGVPDGDAELVTAGLSLLAELAHAVSPPVRPAVTHLDVYLPNILVGEDGRFRALLDFEHLRWADPVLDFVKPAMWMFERRPGWAEAFTGGYRAAGEWPRRWAERFAVASGLELLLGLDHWARTGERAMYDDYLRRLRTWVRSDGADHAWPATVT